MEYKSKVANTDPVCTISNLLNNRNKYVKKTVQSKKVGQPTLVKLKNHKLLNEAFKKVGQSTLVVCIQMIITIPVIMLLLNVFLSPPVPAHPVLLPLVHTAYRPGHCADVSPTQPHSHGVDLYDGTARACPITSY